MNYTPQINYHEAVKRWCKRVEEYNNQCASVSYQRQIKLNGDVIERTITRKKGTIKAAVKATGMHLIAQYAEAWANANRHHHNMAHPDDVYLRTNRVEIGERLQRSPRSVYDHVQKLIEVGLISKYIFCGRQHSYRLWISPQILFGEKSEKAEKIVSKASKSPLSVSVRQNLPPSDISQKQPSTTIIAVDSGKTRKQQHGNNEDPHSLAQNANKPANSKPSTETRQPGGRGGDFLPPVDNTAPYAKFLRLPAYFKTLSLNFWLLARTTLYPGKQFSDHDNNEAVLAIVEGVFGGFRVNMTDREWDNYYNELVQRVNMASDWFHQNPHRHPDLPYQAGRKMGYFDPLNHFGFSTTATWLEKDKLRKRKNRVEYLLNAARIDFENLAAGKPRAKHIEKNELQLFVYYQNLAKPYGQDVVERFCEQYLKQKANNFRPAKRNTITIRAQKAADKKTAHVVYVESWMNEMGEGFYSDL
ncbi:hypothetical protein [Runella zeae]|uniref:hypothetical protein n=1 Tax=Runella zeae TaxID=94255 RepID=UPI00040631C9|nr:hypothetical protein [Runella zeae]